MFNKAQIFNLALQALLLSKQISNPNSDRSNENAVLNTSWDIAYKRALADLDLDSTSSQVPLELMHDFTKDSPPPVGQAGPQWKYAYKYPDKCAFFRKIISCNVVDDRHSHIPKRVMIWNAKKVIMTNEYLAIAEYIPVDFPLQTLSAPGGYAVAMMLALQSTPLIVGKGSKVLLEKLFVAYKIAKAEAKAHDTLESFSFQSEQTMSEFVRVRTT